jgi:hypothetical protein
VRAEHLHVKNRAKSLGFANGAFNSESVLNKRCLAFTGDLGDDFVTETSVAVKMAENCLRGTGTIAASHT